jgi:hypothetical protein
MYMAYANYLMAELTTSSEKREEFLNLVQQSLEYFSDAFTSERGGIIRVC